MRLLRLASEKRAFCIIILIAIVMRIGLAFRSEERIFARPFVEDSFYLFTCAEHIAHGEGFTVDGAHPTNGVQPLVTALYAPLFLLSGFDKLLALKLAFFYIACFDALSIVFLFLLLKALQKKVVQESRGSVWLSPPIIAALLWATLYPIYVHTISGLETGLYSTLLIASLWLYARVLRSRNEGEKVSGVHYIIIGIVLGFTVLARIDAAIFVAMIALYETSKYKMQGLRSAIIISVIAFAVSSTWWYYNYSVFGHLMPQSGFAESLDDELVRNVWQMFTVIADSVTVFFFLPKAVDVSHFVSAIWAVVVCGSVLYIFRKWKLADVIKNNYNIGALTPLLATCVAFTLFYIFFFGAPHFIPRYMNPLRIYTLIFAAIFIPVAFEKLTTTRMQRVILFSFIAVAFLFSFIRYGYYFTVEDTSDFYRTGKWASQFPEAKIGMEQSGTAGYVSPNIFNLDGKVNYEALEARRKGDLGGYIARMEFDYIADWKEKAEPMARSVQTYGLKYEFIDSIGRVQIFKRIQ
jgi:hypothetical protein